MKKLQLGNTIKCLFTLVFVLVALNCAASKNEIKVNGKFFTLNGTPFKMWGVRLASASITESAANELIANLDEYKSYGINAFSVFLQGSSGITFDPFNETGTTIDKGIVERTIRIIEECDKRDMVVILGIFYQSVKEPKLKDWLSCQRAVKLVAETFKPYRNVIINIANEQNSEEHLDKGWANVTRVEGIIELANIVRKSDPYRIVGGGGFSFVNNLLLARSKDIDVLLFDTFFATDNSEHWYDYICRGQINKPIVNVECLGYSTKFSEPQGVFGPNKYFADGKKEYTDEIDRAIRTPGLYVFFHSTLWYQGLSKGFPQHYDIGGMGTKDDPGVRWYFEYLKNALTNSVKTSTFLSSLIESDVDYLLINAADFPVEGTGFYKHKGWLAINPDKNKLASAQIEFKHREGEYDLLFSGVGEYDGESGYELSVNGKKVMKYNVPLSKYSFEEGVQYSYLVKNIQLKPGDKLKVKAFAGTNGTEFSRGRWGGMVLVKAGDGQMLMEKLKGKGTTEKIIK